ncbi:hypothetical protein BN1708_019406, partial [Verticillium longisporum]
HRQRH